MSVPNQEFFHFASYGSGYDPTWYNHHEPTWLTGGNNPSNKKEGKDTTSSDGEQVTELKVNLCCEGCVEKVYKRVKAMDGVANVHCNQDKHKVTVTGYAKPERILKEVKKINHLSGSTLWPTSKK
jgi:copper chaperone CopZ